MLGPCWEGIIHSDEEMREVEVGEGTCRCGAGSTSEASTRAPPCSTLAAAGQPRVHAAVGIRSESAGAAECRKDPREAEAAKAHGVQV